MKIGFLLKNRTAEQQNGVCCSTDGISDLENHYAEFTMWSITCNIQVKIPLPLYLFIYLLLSFGHYLKARFNFISGHHGYCVNLWHCQFNTGNNPEMSSICNV